MATGTIVYNKDQQQIYPISDGSVIISNASGSKSNVEEDLKKLFKQVSDLSGSSEAVNNIIIKIHYLPADTAEESEIKLSSKQWTDTFELPTEENPYIWKRTKFTFQGADESQGTTIYEIVASDVSTIIQNIYTRTEGITPVIEYKQKTDEDGNPLYVNSEGHETTTVTPTKAYDYNYYWNGKPAGKLNSLPPTPEGQSYTWTDYPQDISLSLVQFLCLDVYDKKVSGNHFLLLLNMVNGLLLSLNYYNMEFSIDIHTQINGEITIEDFSKEYGQYIDEDLEVVTSYDSYKYSESATLNTIIKVSIGDATLIDVLLNDHTEDLDSCTFKVKEDGYYVVDHIILPNMKWYENSSDEYKEYYETIYITDGEKLYKEVDGELEECTVKNP